MKPIWMKEKKVYVINFEIQRRAYKFYRIESSTKNKQKNITRIRKSASCKPDRRATLTATPAVTIHDICLLCNSEAAAVTRGT